MTALVIAAHGTRLPEGQQACRALVDRVRGLLPGVVVSAGYVELDTPSVADAVADALGADSDRHVVVVPLMIGTGGHVRDDIPEGIAAGRARVPGGVVSYAPHLGPDPRLRAAVLGRISEAQGEWSAGQTSVVLLGRGTSVTDANADHARLARVLLEEGGFADVIAGFIQVSRPNLASALDGAYAHGGRRIVVMPHFLFPGRLLGWTQQQTAEWQQAHPDAEVRISDVIGDCDELAAVVADRYREAAAPRLRHTWHPEASPVYLSGLVLRGRKVVVAGGGTVASRRVGKLLDAGACVQVVAPTASQQIQGLAAAGKLSWSARPIAADDLAGAWYVLALTDDPVVNAAVADWAEQTRVFCVRGDDAQGGSAWTPATGLVDGLMVGVVGNRDPHRSARARTAAVAAIRELNQL